MDEKRTRHFKAVSSTQRLAPDITARHGKAASLAFVAFGEAGSALTFLNSHNESLGGRPLDVAGASDQGLKAVQTELSAHRSS